MQLDKLILELKYNTENIPHLDGFLFQHLYGTYRILKEKMGKPEYLCVAGLMHSVYETEYFTFDTPYTREYVKSQVGDRAENLVYEFCYAKPRIDCLITNNKNWSTDVYADLLDMELANMQEQGFYNGQIKIIETIRKHL